MSASSPTGPGSAPSVTEMVTVIRTGRVHRDTCHYLTIAGPTRPATDLDLSYSPRCACWTVIE